MGLTFIKSGKHRSKRRKEHKIYSYLLRDYTSEGLIDVLATDITYMSMAKGLYYLEPINDFVNSKVMNWLISNTMDGNWCKEALEDTINKNFVPAFSPLI